MFQLQAQKICSTMHSKKIKSEKSPYKMSAVLWKMISLPSLFVNSLRNIMPDDRTNRDFLKKSYQLAKKGQQKTKKLCCVGDADSGKTSWFAPFEGIISHEKLATVTRGTVFCKHAVERNRMFVCWRMTPWCVERGWCEKSTAKGFLGNTAEAQTSPLHHKPTSFVYNSDVNITYNQIPYFFDVDDAAIRARLAVFKRRSLPAKNTNAINWLGKNACIASTM